ncbi:DUF5753 domain-containing protein, partial [Frankia sp. Cr1]|uniref:DUF5753 domain-containing protein n=1 Tax=Frankia sp. Cr1 TaxID=3073931 RepID=UPI002AD3F0CD
MKLLDHYGVANEDVRGQLLDLVRDSREQDWWHSFPDAVPRWFERFMAAESSAVSVEKFETQIVPGLLQTPEYARAVFRAANTSLDDDEIDRRVTVRMERQKRLTGNEPLTLWVVLDESVLRRHVAGPMSCGHILIIWRVVRPGRTSPSRCCRSRSVPMRP